MLHFYYLIYVLAWLFGISRSSGGAATTCRVGARISVAALLGFVLFFAAISGIQMGGLIFSAVPIFILIPLLSVGVGLTISTAARIAYLRGVKVTAFAISVISLMAPFGAILFFWMDHQASEAQRKDELATFQAGNLVGRIGDKVVNFPASPQLETIHNCQDAQRCRTKFQKSGDQLQYSEGDLKEEVLFEEIVLIPIHGTCEGSSAPKNSCLRMSEHQEWCAIRVEISKGIWCQAKPRHKTVFSSVERGQTHLHNDPSWTIEASESYGTDFAGVPITIECSKSRDRTILSNAHLSRYCRVKYYVSEEVIATIFLDKFDSSEMNTEATVMLDYANEHWATLIQ